jgi:hypothetical protein
VWLVCTSFPLTEPEGSFKMEQTEQHVFTIFAFTKVVPSSTANRLLSVDGKPFLIFMQQILDIYKQKHAIKTFIF